MSQMFLCILYSLLVVDPFECKISENKRFLPKFGLMLVIALVMFILSWMLV